LDQPLNAWKEASMRSFFGVELAGAALAECRQYAEAVNICSRAIERMAGADQGQRQQLLARQALYRSRQPFRDPALKSSGKQT
jgi:hypothetical protein